MGEPASQTNRGHWHAFAVMIREPSRLPDQASASVVRLPTGWQVELSGSGRVDWATAAPRLLLHPQSGADEWLLTGTARDEGSYCAAVLTPDDHLLGALFVTRGPVAVARDWLAVRLGTPLDAGERFRLLDGRPSGAMTPRRRLVCVCCQVGDSEIEECIASGGSSVEAVGRATRAGTNCGRCRPLIATMIEGALPLPA